MAITTHHSPDTAPAPQGDRKEPIDVDSTQPIEHSDKRRRSKRGIIAGIVAATAVVGGAMGLAMSGGGESEEVKAEMPVATAPATQGTEVTAPTTQPPETEPVTTEKRPEIGVIDTLYIAPGESTFTHTTPNGQEVQVPRPGEFDPDNPNEFMSRFLATFAACVENPTDECVNAISSAPDMQSMMRRQHDNTIGRFVEGGIPNAQVSIYDKKGDPAVFEVTSPYTNGYTVNLTGGTLLMHFHDNDWQSVDESFLYPDTLVTTQFDQLELIINNDPSTGTTNVESMTYDANRVVG